MAAHALLSPDNRLLGWSTSDFSLYGALPAPEFSIGRSTAPDVASLSPHTLDGSGSAQAARATTHDVADAVTGSVSTESVPLTAVAQPQAFASAPSPSAATTSAPDAMPLVPQASGGSLAPIAPASQTTGDGTPVSGGIASSHPLPTKPVDDLTAVHTPSLATLASVPVAMLIADPVVSGIMPPFVAPTLNTAADAISGVLGSAAGTITIAHTTISDAVSTVQDVVGTVTASIAPVADSIVAPVPLQAAEDGVAATTATVAGLTSPLISGVDDTVHLAATTPADLAVDPLHTVDAVADPVVSELADVTTSSLGTATPIAEAATPAVTTAGDAIETAAIPAATTIVDAAQTTTDALTDTAAPTIEAASTPAASIADITAQDASFGGTDPAAGIATLVSLVDSTDAFDLNHLGNDAEIDTAPSILDTLAVDEAPSLLLGDAGHHIDTHDSTTDDHVGTLGF